MVIKGGFFIWLAEEKIYIKEKMVVGKVDILNVETFQAKLFTDMFIPEHTQKPKKN